MLSVNLGGRPGAPNDPSAVTATDVAGPGATSASVGTLTIVPCDPLTSHQTLKGVLRQSTPGDVTAARQACLEAHSSRLPSSTRTYPSRARRFVGFVGVPTRGGSAHGRRGRGHPQRARHLRVTGVLPDAPRSANYFDALTRRHDAAARHTGPTRYTAGARRPSASTATCSSAVLQQRRQPDRTASRSSASPSLPRSRHPLVTGAPADRCRHACRRRPFAGMQEVWVAWTGFDKLRSRPYEGPADSTHWTGRPMPGGHTPPRPGSWSRR
jgi:hypothetical protein